MMGWKSRFLALLRNGKFVGMIIERITLVIPKGFSPEESAASCDLLLERNNLL